MMWVTDFTARVRTATRMLSRQHYTHSHMILFLYFNLHVLDAMFTDFKEEKSCVLRCTCNVL
jgi:hypothetical protein